MDNKSFWLANINNHVVSISLIDLTTKKFSILAVGPELSYDESLDSFINAVDQSLSDAANQVNLPSEDEPNSIALIIPPFWVGSDGKIITEKLKVFESLFRELKLKPMGFISNDEALVEEANQFDGFPASFVLVNLSPTEMVVSLTYLGKVIERIIKPIADKFSPILLELTLQEFKTESTLPPQIILIGDFDEDLVDNLKNFAWIGKKNIETFLHFPDIKTHSPKDLVTIYSKAITSQFSEPVSESRLVPPPEEISTEYLPPPVSDTVELEEVTAGDLGFGNQENFTIPTDYPQIISSPEPIDEDIFSTPPSTSKKPFKINLPKFNLPKFNLKIPSPKIYYLFPLALAPLLLLIPFFFSQATITLFLTPYAFSKDLTVTFDPEAQAIDIDNKIIPINRNNYDITNTDTIPTTGKVTTGEKARGEIIVYNKQDKTQNISKGAILTDEKGNKYEISSAVQIVPSSSNLDLGVINLGQTKTMVMAADIGPEFNLSKDIKLRFKDFPETSLVAKVSESIAGGTKNEINAVGTQDRQKLEQQLNEKINTDVDARLNQELLKNPGIIKDAVQIKKGRIEFNREVGEEANELVATAISTVYVFYLDNDKKSQMLNAFLASEPGFNDSQVNPNDFTLNIKPNKNTIDKIQGLMSISGKSTPKINQDYTAKLLSGKSQSNAQKIIKSNIPRVYNYQITTNFNFLKAINPLPFKAENIKVEIK